MVSKHICTQESKISDLSNKQETFMDIMKEVKWDVKDIKKYLFEWWLEKKYSTKEEMIQYQELQKVKDDNLTASVKYHQDIITKLAWFIVLWVLVFIASSALTIFKIIE